MNLKHTRAAMKEFCKEHEANFAKLKGATTGKHVIAYEKTEAENWSWVCMAFFIDTSRVNSYSRCMTLTVKEVTNCLGYEGEEI